MENKESNELRFKESLILEQERKRNLEAQKEKNFKLKE